jgi:hypothetical protein
MSLKKNYLLKGLNLISWIIFIGVSIDAGGMVFNSLYSIFINSKISSHFWGYIDLSSLYQFNKVSYITLITLMSLVTILKAILFYIILKIFHNKVDLSNPFNEVLGKHIKSIAYCSLSIGLFSMWGGDLLDWSISQNILMPSIQKLKLSGDDVWFLMGFVVMVFALIFEKGIQLKNENDLTV